MPTTKYTTTFDVLPDWDGKFVNSKPDLNSIEVTKNMDNIPKLKRQMKIKWPEFSWQVNQGHEESRVYQKFCEDISRVGYDNDGQIWSIICPQKAVYSEYLGCSLNIEVTVTGVRGCIDEVGRQLSADVSAEYNFWFSSKNNRILNAIAKGLGYQNFPFVKSKAVNIPMHAVDNPNQSLSRFYNGADPDIPEPVFSQHLDEAVMVGHIKMQVGSITQVKGRNAEMVNAFNELVVDLINIGSGNIAKPKNLLQWNIWLDRPEVVNQQEWQEHAEKWRDSLEEDGKTPIELDPPGPFRLYDGSTAHLTKMIDLGSEIEVIGAFIGKHIFPRFTPPGVSPSMINFMVNPTAPAFTEEDHEVLMDVMKDYNERLK